jgi:hypothetical protein
VTEASCWDLAIILKLFGLGNGRKYIQTVKDENLFLFYLSTVIACKLRPFGFATFTYVWFLILMFSCSVMDPDLNPDPDPDPAFQVIPDPDRIHNTGVNYNTVFNLFSVNHLNLPVFTSIYNINL